MEGIVGHILTAITSIFCTILVIYKNDVTGYIKRGKRNWSGRWIGQGTSDDPKATYSLSATLKQHGNKVTGILETHSPESLQYSIEGIIKEPEYITFSSTNTNSKTINYLVGIARMDRKAKTICCEYIARSRLSENLVKGKLDLQFDPDYE